LAATMIAQLLNISDEQLGKIMAEWMYGDRDIPISLFDIFATAIMTWNEVVRLRGRMNAYDAKGLGALLTVNETMRLTGLSRSSVNRKMRDYTFSSIKDDGRRYIYRTSVEVFLDTVGEYRCNPWNPRAGMRLGKPAPDRLQKLTDAVRQIPPIIKGQATVTRPGNSASGEATTPD
jgi:hypothetical protein